MIGLAGLLGSGADRMLRRLLAPAADASRSRSRADRRGCAHPGDAIAQGIGMVPGERALGLVMNQSVRDNILLPQSRRAHTLRLDRSPRGRPPGRRADGAGRHPPAPAALAVRALSGGNQQKVILAKWLARRTAVLLLDEPTQGIDVAAKAQVHALIRDFVARGGGAWCSSSDLAELARLCDRVLAVRRGRITATLDRDQTVLDEPRLRAAIGGER